MSRLVFSAGSYWISHSVTPKGASSKDHYGNHPFAVTALLRGTGRLFVEGSSYDLAPGDVAVLRSSELRRFQFDQDVPHERISIYLTPAALTPLLDHRLPLLQLFTGRPLGTGNLLKPGARAGVLLARIGAMTDALSRERDSLQEAELHLLVLQLLLELYGCAGDRTDDSAGDPAIRDLCCYIHDHLPEKLSYRHLQEHCRVSRYQLGEVFPRFTGMTVTEYIIQKRLIRVSELMLQGAKLESAALRAGFPNYSHFYKMFIKYRGISPKQYFQL